MMRLVSFDIQKCARFYHFEDREAKALRGRAEILRQEKPDTENSIDKMRKFCRGELGKPFEEVEY